MAKKPPTISSSLFQPTVPRQPVRDPNYDQQQQPYEPPAWEPEPPPKPVEDPKHHTSTRIPLKVHGYFEELAEEYGYSTHSLRVYALSWFVREHKDGNIRLERDRTVRGKRVLAMPDVE